MRNAVITSVVAGAAAIALGIGARAQVQTLPGPGSGIVTVTGRVEVADGVIHAVQNGEWKVLVANAPDVRVVNTPTVAPAPLPFLKVGARIAIIWPDGVRDTLQISQLGGGSWILADGSSRPRWINLTGARSIEDAK
jgi:hypothetical protein